MAKKLFTPQVMIELPVDVDVSRFFVQINSPHYQVFDCSYIKYFFQTTLKVASS